MKLSSHRGRNRGQKLLWIHNSYVRVYLIELLLNGWTNFVNIFVYVRVDSRMVYIRNRTMQQIGRWHGYQVEQGLPDPVVFKIIK